MTAEIVNILMRAIEAAYGRYDDIAVTTFRSKSNIFGGITEYAVQVLNGEDDTVLYTVDACIDHIKEVVD